MIQEIEKVTRSWNEIKDILTVPNTESQYKKMQKALDQLIDLVGNDEKHPLALLMDTIGNLLDIYEKENNEFPDAEPIEVLNFFMKENNLHQKDLHFLGSQGVVSELLSGKRKLNLRQIKILAERFHVSPAVFIS